MLEVGNKAPAFSLLASNGQTISLASLAGRNVVIVFYPENHTPGWDGQLADLESRRAQFESHNTLVMAINNAGIESHAEYCSSNGFGFPILSDPDMAVIDAFGCRNESTGRVSRAVFALDTNGRIVFAEPGKASFADALTAIQNAKGWQVYTDNDMYDISFIGAGPVALYGMYYAGLRMTKFKTIDMLEEVGGGLMALYPEKYIYDVGGFPKILAKDLVHMLKEQASHYPHTFCLGEKVCTIERTDNSQFRITTDKGVHFSKTVVVCAGMGAYVPKPLDVANVKELEGKGVYYFVRRLADFKDKHILVVGGGDSAFDYSMMLEPVAKSITHIHRNDFFSAHEASVTKVKQSRVRLKFPFWEIKRLEGESWVRRVTIVQTQTGEEETFDLDALVLNIGFLTNLGPIADWGLHLEKNAIVVDSRMRTNIDGIYAAGDIVTYDGKLKLISVGFGEVAIAVNNAKNYIDPRARVNPGHSTEKHEVVSRKVHQAQTHSQQSEEK